MAKPNRNRREFNTVFRRSTIVHPVIATAKQMSGTIHDYVDVRTIDTRGTWPMVHMISEASLVRLGVAAGQLPPDALEMLGKMPRWGR